ncbi:phage tail protein [Salmonella enterica]|nr:phage tail protein [Salmonella enterica]
MDGGGEFAFGKNGEFYSPSHIHVGGAVLNANGDTYGSVWGNQYISTWLSNNFASRDNNINACATIDWVRRNFLSGFRLGAVESAQVWRAYGYNDQPPYVITGVINGNTDDLIDVVTRRTLQMYINGWRNIDWT